MQFDVIVVGGGHNGLVCSCYLAAAGLSVCVLERHGEVGGAAITETFHPGFRNSTASYTVSLLQQKIIADLGLFDKGLRILRRPLDNFVPSMTGPGLELSAERAARLAAIAAHSRADAERYAGYLDELELLTRLLKPLLLEPPLDPSGDWRERWRCLKELWRFGGGSARQWSVIWQLLTGSAGDWLDRHFETDLLKGGLGFDSIVGHFASPYEPGSTYLLLHHALGQVDGAEGAWGHAVGGMGAITQTLARVARERGATIETDAAVDSIVPAGRGFEVAAGTRRLGARVVAAAIHPQTLFLDLLEGVELPADFRERIVHWRSESASLRVNVALSELPDFKCLPGRKPGPHHGAGILVAPSLDYLERAHRDARASGYSPEPVIELVIPSTIDATLAPRGTHVASLFCQHFRRHLPDGVRWPDSKAAALERIVATVDEYAPNFRASIIALEAYTPEELEQRFGLVGGDIFHGSMHLDQLYWSRPAWGYAHYRMPVEGLYLCASGAHPGGGVSGAPGHNAARAILEDLGRA